MYTRSCRISTISRIRGHWGLFGLFGPRRPFDPAPSEAALEKILRRKRNWLIIRINIALQSRIPALAHTSHGFYVVATTIITLTSCFQEGIITLTNS